MGVFIRGAKNAFRNTIRTVSVTVILSLSIGLALIMLLSYKTVQAKIENVKGTIGNTITITPAGAQGFQGGGEPLTEAQATDVRAIANVSSVSEELNDRLTPSTDTSLVSAIEPGSLGTRFRQRDSADSGAAPPDGAAPFGGNAAGGTGATRTFTLPIQVTGVADPVTLTTGTSKLTAGDLFATGSGDSVAIVGTTLATKNSLSVGSTFTAYGTTLKVVGIYDAGNTFSNAGIYMPIKALQTLSSQADQVSSMTVTVNSITNVPAATDAIKAKLGTDKADVVSNVDAATTALAPLENIKNISLYSLIGALVAGAIITLLTMVMIVRERRREIGVLKAIGSSNVGVVMQFVSESLVLTLLGSVVGAIVGALFSNPVLNALVTNSTATTATTAAAGPGGGRGFARVAQLGAQLGGGGVQNTVRNLHATIGTDLILYGLLAAVGIAILGSAIPAWLIAKVKPADVMRAE